MGIGGESLAAVFKTSGVTEFLPTRIGVAWLKPLLVRSAGSNKSPTMGKCPKVVRKWCVNWAPGRSDNLAGTLGRRVRPKLSHTRVTRLNRDSKGMTAHQAPGFLADPEGAIVRLKAH